MIELISGGARARIDPADGGRLVSLVLGDVERILPKASARASAPALYWGCYPMVPWPGRLANGLIPTPQGEVRLEANLPPSAIHGLGFDKRWSVVERSHATATLGCDLRGLRWPFGGRTQQTLTLNDTTLDLELEVAGYTRTGPVGLGWHPWFTRPLEGDVELRLEASEVLVVDSDVVPTGEARAVRPNEDLRAGPALAERRLDHVYIRTTGPATLRWPDLELDIEYGEDLSTVVVHTPGEGICVEPQTMWPNAPLLATRGVTGTGLRTLEPGESFSVRERWTWRPRARG